MKAISEFVLILPLGLDLKSSQSYMYFPICIPGDAASIAKYATYCRLHVPVHVLFAQASTCFPPNWATRPYIVTDELLNGLSALAVLFVNKISEIHYDLPATILLYPTFTNRTRQIRSLLFKSQSRLNTRVLEIYQPGRRRRHEPCFSEITSQPPLGCCEFPLSYISRMCCSTAGIFR